MGWILEHSLGEGCLEPPSDRGREQPQREEEMSPTLIRGIWEHPSKRGMLGSRHQRECRKREVKEPDPKNTSQRGMLGTHIREKAGGKQKCEKKFKAITT